MFDRWMTNIAPKLLEQCAQSFCDKWADGNAAVLDAQKRAKPNNSDSAPPDASSPMDTDAVPEGASA